MVNLYGCVVDHDIVNCVSRNVKLWVMEKGSVIILVFGTDLRHLAFAKFQLLQTLLS